MSSRYWCFTANLTDEETTDYSDLLNSDDENISYAVWQLEKGEKTEHNHIQGYVEFEKKIRLAQVKRILLPELQPHLEMRSGTADEAASYCKKSETRLAGPWEFGNISKGQGHRSDLDSIHKEIKEGHSLLEIAESHPGSYIRYNRGIEKLITLMKQPPKIRENECIVYYGKAGVGKTYKVVTEVDDLFILGMDDNKSVWWDTYNNEKNLLLDEFSGQLNLSLLLRILDIYKMRIPVKGGFTWAMWNKVYITSNTHPSKWYDHLTPEQDAALKRRIKQVYYFKSRDKIILSKPIGTVPK